MKTNKYSDLVKFGLTPKTLMTLSESDINKLHKNLIESKKDVCPKCGMKNCKCNHSKKKETKEQTQLTPLSQLPQQKTTKTTRTLPATKTTDVNGVRITAGSSPTKIEMPEGKKKSDKNNPWSICTSQLGKEFGTTERHLWSAKEKNKYERCVKQVKQSVKENKNPFDVILENKILSLVEKHLKPKMTKGDLMDLLGKKSEMKTPIGKLGSIGVNENTKEKEAPVKDPGTKTPPKPKTKDPFKPEPHKQPNPKAKHKKHETKEAVMDAPVKEPKVTPGTKTPPKPKTKDPFKPEPHKQPNPKARKRIPSWLSFKNLGIKFKK